MGKFLQMGLDRANQIDPVQEITFFKTPVHSLDGASGSVQSAGGVMYVMVIPGRAQREPGISRFPDVQLHI
jgi:hypothetical protein